MRPALHPDRHCKAVMRFQEKFVAIRKLQIGDTVAIYFSKGVYCVGTVKELYTDSDKLTLEWGARFRKKTWRNKIEFMYDTKMHETFHTENFKAIERVT